MKLDVIKNNQVEKLGEQEDIEFGVDKEDEWIIFKAFTEYSDPLGSIIREITSNAFDANLDTDPNFPVEIEIIEEDEVLGTSCSICFRDRGPGMTPTIIKTIYSKFGKSTKRNRSDAIGAFGFGAKSPLAYTDMFELITVAEGVRYHYAVHKGERRPIITLLDSVETDQPTGTEVRITIDPEDLDLVKESLRTTLTYFDNITYKNCDISNDYQIIEGKHFVFRTDSGSYEPMHICLGKVRYPLSSTLFNVPTIPVGLKFEIGELPVVWNREGIEYTKEAKELIQEKIDLVTEELQTLYDEKYRNIDSLEEFLTRRTAETITIKVNDSEYNIPDPYKHVEKAAIYPKYPLLKVKRSTTLFSVVTIDKFITRNSISNYTPYYGSMSKVDFFERTDTLFLERGESISSLKGEYIREVFLPSRDIYRLTVVRPVNEKSIKRNLMKYYFHPDFVRNPYNFDKDTRQAVIEQIDSLYDEIIEYIKSNCILLDEVEITEDFIERKEAEAEAEKKRKAEEFHFLETSRWGSFNRVRMNGFRLKSYFSNDVVIYGFHRDRAALREALRIIDNETYSPGINYIHVIQISMRNERVVKEVLGDRAYHVSDITKYDYMRRIANRYNKKAWINRLYENGLKEINRFTTTVFRSPIPNYITPEEPTEEEKRSFYKHIGEIVKYPLIPYIRSSAPEEEIELYKKHCRYHHINPILIGKRYVKQYESSSNKEQPESDTDSGN